MAISYEKVDDKTLKASEVQTAETTYNIDMLKNEKAMIESRLAVINALIAEADNLGIS